MQVIQYINLINTDYDTPSSPVRSSDGRIFSYLSAGEFQGDHVDGHGTHTAGSAAGATLNTPAETATCSETTKVPGCVGSCIDVASTSWGDDVLYPLPDEKNIDVLCPMLGCDDETDQRCLSDDVGQTLAENGGMAQGAKIAFFDIFSAGDGYGSYPGNGLWESCLEAGCKVHSNSWGEEDPPCLVRAMDLEYDDFMYKVRFGRYELRPNTKYIIATVYRWIFPPSYTTQEHLASVLWYNRLVFGSSWIMSANK